MPYSGADDPNLPSNVRKLPEKRRRQWIHVYNSERGKGRDDGSAIRIANGVVKGTKAMDEKETSYAPFVDYEVKMDGEDNGIVDGYASVFEHRDHSKDRVLPGAFTKTLAERSKYIVYLPSHDYKVHVKDIPGVPLEVREDSKGLFTSTKFFLNTQAGKDSFSVIKEYQKAGRALGLSFTFRPTAKGSKMTSKGRDLSEVELYEYGHTALPMNDMARTVNAKSDHTNSMMHSEEVDHSHHHGETVHSHPHQHDTKGGMYYGTSHDYHDHTAEQMKSLVKSEVPHYWDEIDEAELTKMASANVALSDKTFPINDEEHVASALEEFEEGRVVNSKRDEVRKHIISRARALGQDELLPDEWLGGSKILLYLPYIDSKEDADTLVTDFEGMIGKKLSDEESVKFRAALAAMDDIRLLTQKEEAETTIQSDDDIKAAQKQRDEIEAALARVRI